MFSRSSGKIDLPSVPATLARIIQITNDPDGILDDLARVVMLDQSLATKVLRVANSAFYGRRTKAEKISDAVATLGFDAVRNLAASASVVEALFPRQMFPGFGWQEMWTHSVMCASAAEVILSYMRGSSRPDESAFAAGLLHDVGKLVLARALPHKFTQTIELCRERGCTMADAERHNLMTDHAQIGGQLMQQWEFPETLTAGVLYHHSPSDAGDHRDLARAVQAANLLAKRIGRPYLLGTSNEISMGEIAEACGLRSDDIEYATVRTRDRLERCGEILAWGEAMPCARRAA